MAACGLQQHIFENPLETSTVLSKIDKTANKARYSTNPTKKFHPNIAMNAESLSMCTEGLGFESFADVDTINDDEDIVNFNVHERTQCFDTMTKHATSEIDPKRSRISGAQFPPPISSIGMSGKPWVCLKSYRSNGRFILKEVRIPTQELLHACREDGRLKLQFIKCDDEAVYDDDNDDDKVKE